MKRPINPKKPSEEIVRLYSRIRGRQILGATMSIWFVVIIAVLSRRPDLFAHIEKGRAAFLQILAIAAFICFTAWNWRCPACDKYLGADFGKKRRCKNCGTELRS